MSITDKGIKGLDRPEKGYQIVYDEEVPGFGVRLTAAGVVSFILNYRIHGRERRYTIGRAPDWTAEAARDEAVYWRRQIAKGKDPLSARHAARTAPTVDALADQYLEAYARQHKRASSLRGDTELLKNRIRPKLGSLKAEAVSRRDIERLHKSMRETPYQANRALALLSKMFNLAVQWEWIEKNPAKGIPRYHEEKRERYLKDGELKALVGALAEYPRFITTAGEEKTDAQKEQSANAVRLLLLTGARRGEVLAARWDQFDLKGGVWTKPSAHTKQKKAHRVPLSAPARQLLTEIKQNAGKSPFVFPGPDADTHQAELKGAWRTICRLAGLENLRIHDLRHSYASQLASAGLSLPIIGALLGHTQAQTTARYTHLQDDPLRAATEKVGAAVEHAGGKKAGAVVPMIK